MIELVHVARRFTPRRRQPRQRRRRRLAHRSRGRVRLPDRPLRLRQVARCCRCSPACSTPTDRATIVVDGKEIDGPGPDRGMVFQRDSVFPWMRVIDNVEYGLKCRGVRAPSGARSRATISTASASSHVERRLAARTFGRHAEARRHRHGVRQWRRGADARRAVRRARLCDAPPACTTCCSTLWDAPGRGRAARCCSSPTTSTRR